MKAIILLACAVVVTGCATTPQSPTYARDHYECERRFLDATGRPVVRMVNACMKDRGHSPTLGGVLQGTLDDLGRIQVPPDTQPRTIVCDTDHYRGLGMFSSSTTTCRDR